MKTFVIALTPVRERQMDTLVTLLGSPEHPIEIAFPRFHLGPLTLSLPSHGIVAVLGDNGAGKSTLLGEIQRRVRSTSLRCAVLAQDFTLPPFARVHDIALFVAEQRVEEAHARRDAVDAALALTDLTQVQSCRVRELSGGMRRRLGIALTVLGNPDLVILDEPSAGLDMSQRLELRELLRSLRRDQLVLISSHIIEDISQTSDHVVMLVKGTKVFEGTSEDFLRHGDPSAPDAWERAYRSLNAANYRGTGS